MSTRINNEYDKRCFIVFVKGIKGIKVFISKKYKNGEKLFMAYEE